ncbi:2-polyprenyl-6-methoxyphenol hydroxylase [Algoriphagus persicinus]|uniref:2-polyprenyl-6-methoxyphenol hydroxylase n=1 Tax=Algoriphagus persicinus TaxID=3108754 RepID=UPI002B3F63D4|nr:MULTISPECIES: 2-polyprenyl-6-methoxyphenol hydroxylase [unclassified Algoriphagus]MEB2782544.1 2-polyprenyl-6-methoxyphenol hydroxylase [Algoriphagus sp. C2-6-M1]MEB2783054.1 2-polyprenyl-6-methoxyphenol hydroxylase [Algoriphagus sp. E1-3-M2]
MKTQISIQKHYLAILASITAFLLISISCSSESEDRLPPPSSVRCEDSNASLSADIVPILQQNCAVSGCHVDGTGRADFTVKDNILQFSSQIRANTQSGIMPPASSGRSLSSEQKELIYCWVTAGAKDN